MLRRVDGGFVVETADGFYALPTDDRELAERWADEDETVIGELDDAGCFATAEEAAAVLM